MFLPQECLSRRSKLLPGSENLLQPFFTSLPPVVGLSVLHFIVDFYSLSLLSHRYFDSIHTVINYSLSGLVKHSEVCQIVHHLVLQKTWHLETKRVLVFNQFLYFAQRVDKSTFNLDLFSCRKPVYAEIICIFLHIFGLQKTTKQIFRSHKFKTLQLSSC